MNSSRASSNVFLQTPTPAAPRDFIFFSASPYFTAFGVGDLESFIAITAFVGNGEVTVTGIRKSGVI